MTKLESKIVKWNNSYREGNPLGSDKDYDSMLIELGQVTPKSSLLKKGVIEKPKTRMEKLPYEMHSLNKLTSMEEVKKWFESNSFFYDEMVVITPKYDAISMIVNEPNGNAWTRGDGIEGQRSDQHFKRTGGTPRTRDIYTSGEMIMPKSFFDKNVGNFQKQDPPYANPRNMAAGLFNADFDNNPDLLGFEYMRYNIFDKKLSKTDQLIKCNGLNKNPVPFLAITFRELFKLGEDLLTDLFNDWKDNPFEIDGIVIDIDSAELRAELGREKNNNPKYARAIKLGWEEEKSTTVKGIEWNISKEGLLKPVILVETTKLSGVNIDRVAGYNASYIFNNNIAKDSSILIKRSGEVIPKHLKTLSYEPTAVFQEQMSVRFCPSCNCLLKWTVNDKGEKVDLKCESLFCKEKDIKKIVHFFQVMDIDNFGEPSIRKLYDYGFDTISDILQMDIPDFEDIDGFGDKSSSALMIQFDRKILNKEGVNWVKLGHALSIFEGLGTKKLILFTKLFDSNYNLDSLRWALTHKEGVIPALNTVAGLSNKTIESFFKGLPKLLLKIAVLDAIGVTITYPLIKEEKAKSGNLNGNIYVFSGFRDKDIEAKIIDNGGLVASGVSKKVTHLVVKDIHANTSKMQKARKNNIIVINKEEIF